MQAQIVKIGNSKGVRIPKVLLEDLNLKGLVELTKTDQGLLISPDKPRSGWSEAFAGAAGKSDKSNQELLDLQNEWDEKEWQW